MNTPPEPTTPAKTVSTERLQRLLQPPPVDSEAVSCPFEPWYEFATSAVSIALENALGRSVHLGRAKVRSQDSGAAGGASATRFPATFGIRIGLAAGGSCLLALDEEAARGWVERLQRDLGGPVGTGELTDAERGLIEYVVLAAADEIGRRYPAVDGTWVIDAFLHGRDLNRTLQETSPSDERVFRLRIGPNEGRVLARLEMPRGANISVPPTAAGTGTGMGTGAGAGAGAGGGAQAGPQGEFDPALESATIDVALALPPIELDLAEVESLRRGDVVLPGMTELTSPGIECTLVTSTGWQLSSVRVLLDSPLVSRVRTGALDPVPLPQAPLPRGRARLRAILGMTTLRLSELSDWATGTELDLPKPAAAPAVRIEYGATHAWLADWVDVDGERGLQIESETEARDPARPVSSMTKEARS